MLEHLVALSRKPERRIAGLMSGTSMDGIDAALVRLAGGGQSLRIHVERFACTAYEPGLRQRLVRAAGGEPVPSAEHARLHFEVASAFARACLDLVAVAGLRPVDVDAIGAHGQTLFHHVPQRGAFGPGTATWQAGSLPVLSALTGILTVGDFRPADIALQGTGAPLVPYCDYVLRRSDSESRLLLNIGGIANFTYLPRRARPSDVLAWDVGPGNLVLDGLASRLLGAPYDRDGAVASRGRADAKWVEELLADEFFQRPPPKSAGREQFGAAYVERFMAHPRAQQVATEDLLATAVELTARAIAGAATRPPLAAGAVDAVYVAGGGRRNRALVERLSALLQPARVAGLEALGLDPDAKEAVDFAVLANETLLGHAGNLPSVTGATRPCILGTIAFAGVPPRVLEPT